MDRNVLIVVVLLGMALQALVHASESTGPVSWWRFENPSSPGMTSGSAPDANLSFDATNLERSLYTVSSVGGVVGSFLKADGSNVSLNISATTASKLPSPSAAPGITVEFLFRLKPISSFNKAGNTTVISTQGDSGWSVVFDRHALGFRAAGRVISVPLVASGIQSYWTLANEKWHHIACRLDGMTGEISIWVDGMSPPAFGIPANRSCAPKTVPPGDGVLKFLPTAFDGDIDEVAVWAEALSNGSIYSHFRTTIENHKPYPLSPSPVPSPPPPTSNSPYSITDFAVGTILPTQIGNSTQGVTMLPASQLKSFPAPRFLPKPVSGPGIGKPQRNFNWCDPEYMAGQAFKYFLPPHSLQNETALVEVDLQRELATNWNYNLNFIHLGHGKKACSPASVGKHNTTIPAQCDAHTQALINLRNENPSWGVDTIFQRQGSKTCANYSDPTSCEKSWRFLNQTLPDSCYLQDEHGKFLTLTGAYVNTSNPKSMKVLRPSTEEAAAKRGCPDELFYAEVAGYHTDGSYSKYGGFKGSISRINNDGEYDVIYMCAATIGVYAMDPEVLSDYKSSSIGNLPDGSPDWSAFASQWRARFSNRFSVALTSDKSNSPELFGALFSEYQVQGTNLFFGTWNETRKINTPVSNGGKLRYYSTGDLYPWIQEEMRFTGLGPHHNISITSEAGVPSWDVSHGSWHSIDWLQQILPSQIQAGDTLWSPFVAAGWSEREELNTRPAQWLGFLKLLTVTGAEFFNTGFFNLHPPFPDPRNWVWQAAAPVYAQAITSNWLDVLYNGELLHGDMPVPPISCQVILKGSDPLEWVPKVGVENCQAVTQKYVPYRFWAGSQSNAVFIRKLKGAQKYVIAGTVQPQSNVADNAPLAVQATVTLPSGGELTLQLRRQGSVYIFENDTRPLMTQVDEWHEATHFGRWSKSFSLEAELHDDHSRSGEDSPVRWTELPTGAAPHDYSFFTTFVVIAPAFGFPRSVKSPIQPLRFTFQPRLGWENTRYREYNVYIRYRVNEQASLNITVIKIDGNSYIHMDLKYTARGDLHLQPWSWCHAARSIRVSKKALDKESVLEVSGGFHPLHLDVIKLAEDDQIETLPEDAQHAPEC